MKNKILLTTFIVSLIILVISIFTPVNAESVEVDSAKIETLTGGTITKDDNKKEVTMTLDAEEINKLIWYAKDDPTYDEDATRPGNGWWIGFRLTLPESVTPSKVTRDVTNVFGESDSKPFNSDNGKPNVCSYWLGIDENRLEGRTSEFVLGTYKFHWDDKDKVDLTVIIKVNPEGVKLTKDPDKLATVKINETFFTLQKGKTLTQDEENGGLTEQEVEKLNKLMTPEEGYKFLGLYDKVTGEKFELTTPVTGDLTLETRFEKVETPKEESKQEPEAQKPEEPKKEGPKKDETPKTGVNPELIVLIFTGLSLIGIVGLKNKNR